MAKNKIQALGSPDRNIERSIEHLYDVVNQLVQMVNQGFEGTPAENQKIRIVIDNMERPTLEIKTNLGWAVSDPSSATGFKIKEN